MVVDNRIATVVALGFRAGGHYICVMSRHDRHIRKAMAAARLSECGFMMGAVVVRAGKILAVGVNKWRCPTISSDEFRTYHAEVMALNGLAESSGATLYVARTGRTGNATMARPCEKCWPVIVEAGIRQVVYTTWEGGYAIEPARGISL